MAQPWAEAFYHSKAWRLVRAQVLRRDLYTCTECRVNRASEVHHIIELTAGNINDVSIALNPDNLTSLCGDCHKKITKGFTGDIVDGYMFDETGQVVRKQR